MLAVLQVEQLMRLERVMQDGTKVKAAAGPRSPHREARLQPRATNLKAGSALE